MILSSTSNILIKLFAKDFLKSNSGFLVFLFGSLASYLFFINTVGDVNLITPEELTFYHFIFVMTFISSPVMTLIIAMLLIIYSVKSWSYICKSITTERNVFLLYSITSLSRQKQFKNWFLVQFVVYLPVLAYCTFALTFGVIFGHILLPFLMLIFLLLMTTFSAWIYMGRMALMQECKEVSEFIYPLLSLGKSQRYLSLYYVAHRQKAALMIVKGLSLILVLFIGEAFQNVTEGSKIAAFFMLSIAISHSYLLIRQHQFLEEYFSLDRNLPQPRFQRFLWFVFEWLLLVIPEIVWLFYSFDGIVAGESLLLSIGLALLLRCILYLGKIPIKRYYQMVFILYFVFLILILYEQTLPLAVLAGTGAFVIFYKKYYNGNGYSL
ncbi:hypothetical protein BDE36_2951 [Arcticibacter tournemirensis]|uniref:Uncharacterized protein n=1 Tax=Arcticibacter tournemirensis TaxID=699437 RepID=A0A5M9GQZ4_9SPHI|nr:hypothetical protein [Arcticibacter tournemirensis]KAA8477173.1 hypothetical protein F1649_19245 [Arcticibacter tournemirensis]TQM51179.1 hypothetical protein BDE36_2951 [Arcticibacter tournemirensis]